MNTNKIINYIKIFDKNIKIMEVCGTHTESISRSGIRSVLPPNIKLVSGPGCPVCVTPPKYIDRLIELSLQKSFCVLSFGDLFKVTGTKHNLSMGKSLGGRIQMIYSPLEALSMAEKNPNVTYIIAAVGFETTIPVYSVLIETAINKNLSNIKLLTSLKATIPAVDFICKNEDIDGFICPGHVASVIGQKPFKDLSNKFNKPMVIAGFDGSNILSAICALINYIDKKKYGSLNLYRSAVKYEGNIKALEIMNKYFHSPDMENHWRGIGNIPNSAYFIKDDYKEFDAGSDAITGGSSDNGCRCGDILLGRISPPECPLFAKKCTPSDAVGACMVSDEGACGIWYQNI